MRRRQARTVLILAGLMWLIATWVTLAGHTLRITIPVSASLIWDQAMPSSPPAVSAVQMVRLELSTSHTDGRIQGTVSGPLIRSDGTILPSDRLRWSLSPSGPFQPFPASSLYSFSQGQFHTVTLYLGIILQDGDLPGDYSGSVLFEYIWKNNSQAETSLQVQIRISQWVRVTYSPNPVLISSSTGGMYDDLTGQSLINVAGSGSWTIDIRASGALSSPQATLAPDQIFYRRLGTTDPWLPLGPDWTRLFTGTGQASFSIEFRVTNPFVRRAGLYTGIFQLRALPL